MTTTTTGPGLRFMQLDVYRVARDMVTRVGRLEVKEVELRSQMRRASTSVLLNLSEGLPSRSAAMRRRYFATAVGSTYEVAAAVDGAMALGVTSRVEGEPILALCDRLGAMLHRMR